MTASTAPKPAPNAADALVREVPTIRPEVVIEGQRVAEWLRSLGMLSTTPSEPIRPFTRRPAVSLPTLGMRSCTAGGWTAARGRTV